MDRLVVQMETDLRYRPRTASSTRPSLVEQVLTDFFLLHPVSSIRPISSIVVRLLALAFSRPLKLAPSHSVELSPSVEHIMLTYRILILLNSCKLSRSVELSPSTELLPSTDETELSHSVELSQSRSAGLALSQSAELSPSPSAELSPFVEPLPSAELSASRLLLSCCILL